jgi:hypothetical protein
MKAFCFFFSKKKDLPILRHMPGKTSSQRRRNSRRVRDRPSPDTRLLAGCRAAAPQRNIPRGTRIAVVEQERLIGDMAIHVDDLPIAAAEFIQQVHARRRKLRGQSRRQCRFVGRRQRWTHAVAGRRDGASGAGRREHPQKERATGRHNDTRSACRTRNCARGQRPGRQCGTRSRHPCQGRYCRRR